MQQVAVANLPVSLLPDPKVEWSEDLHRIGELIKHADIKDRAAPPDPAAEPEPPPKRSGFPLLKPLPERDSSECTPAPEAQWVPPWEE